jgi:hypothetical protein
VTLTNLPAGTATSGVDYTGLGSSTVVVVPALSSSIDVTISAQSDTLVESDETVVADVASTPSSYSGRLTASSADATLTINNVIPADITPPEIDSIKVAGSGWDATFVSEVDGMTPAPGMGEPDARGYQIPSGPSQLTPLPWSNLNRIVINVSEAVKGSGLGGAFQTSDFSLYGVNTLDYSSLITAIDFNSTLNSIVISLSAPLPTDKYLLYSADGAVKDLADNSLGEVEYRFNVLVGDVNQGGAVNVADRGLVVSTDGVEIGELGYTIFKDLNGSGVVNIADRGIVTPRQGDELPDDEPVAP